MKLYDNTWAPNPRRVRIFLAEKGLSIALEQVDLGKHQHKGDTFRAVNPMQRVPVLELDDGTLLAESVVICRYIEALHPEPNLFGAGALEQALVEMWSRRIELHLFQPTAHVFRHLHPAMAALESPQVPAWAEANKPRVADMLEILDAELAGRPFIAGDRFTIADITGLVALDFLKPARLAVSEGLTQVRRWHEALAARPSAGA